MAVDDSGAGEDAAVEARAERTMRVHWFGCGVRLPLLQDLASGGNSRGGEASAADIRPREAGACGTTGPALAGWSKKTRG